MKKRSGWIAFFAVLEFIIGIFTVVIALGKQDRGISVSLMILGGLGITVGFGLLNSKSWARATIILKSIPELFFFFPVGAVISGAIICYFIRKKTKSYFIVEPAIRVSKFLTFPSGFLLVFQKRMVAWRFSKAWKSFCVSQRVAKNGALAKGLIALRKNNRKKARKIWESLQRNFPKDYRINHSLALLNYWGTVPAENPKSLNDETIRKTIGNWAMLLHSDFFWETWRKERQPFYFQSAISKDQIEELRRALKTHLENTISRAYQNLLSLELKTVELISNVANWGKKKGLDSQLLIAGPLMLRELGMLKKARRLVLFGLQVEPENNEFKSLSLYLSPLGIATLLLRAERVENTFEELGKIENRDRWITKEFQEEFNEAIIKWANQSQNDYAAIDRLERATKIILSNELSYLLSTYYEKVAIEVVNEYQDWDKAIEYLKRALNLFRSVKIEKNLAVCLHQRASEKINNLLKALERLPNKQSMLLQPSCDYCGKYIIGQYMEREINNQKYNMCMSCRNKGIVEREKVLIPLSGECLDDLREANKLDPENQNIRKNLQALEKIISQIRESVNASLKNL